VPTPTIAFAGGCFALGLTSYGLARKRHAVKAAIDRSARPQVGEFLRFCSKRGSDPNRLELDSPVRRNALGDLYDFIREVETANSGPVSKL